MLSPNHKVPADFDEEPPNPPPDPPPDPDPEPE